MQSITERYGQSDELFEWQGWKMVGKKQEVDG